jgi:predicted kinase
MNKLYILCGIPFAGKSTLANEMVKQLGCKKVNLDVIKVEMFGKYQHMD